MTTTESALDKVIRDGVMRGMVGNFARLSENIGDQLARELWTDTDFRQELQTLMRQFGKDALQKLTNPPPPPQLEELLARLTKIEERLGIRERGPL